MTQCHTNDNSEQSPNHAAHSNPKPNLKFPSCRRTVSHHWLSFHMCHLDSVNLFSGSHNDSQSPPAGTDAVKQTYPRLAAAALASLAVPDSRHVRFDLVWNILPVLMFASCAFCVRKKQQEAFRAVLYKPLLYPHLAALQFTKHAHTLAL